jgi:hypothetical protein
LLPGQLSRENTEDICLIEVELTQAPNWEVLVFTLAEVELHSPNLQLTIKSYEVRSGQYMLRLSASRLVNAKLLNQRILQLYPKMFERFMAQRQTILSLLEVKGNWDLNLEVITKSQAPPPPAPPALEHQRRLYIEVVHQIQRIIIVQPPEQFVESVQRLLEFLRQQNISTQEIQKKVISQVIKKRAEKDEVFQKQLLQWEEAADEAARFSIVGQAVRLAIALLWSDTQSL